MNRYEFNLEPLDSDVSPDGTFVLYEDVEPIIADRDIKTANLKTLVGRVLEYKESRDSAVGGPEHIDTYEAERLFDELVDLAEGLKQ